MLPRPAPPTDAPRRARGRAANVALAIASVVVVLLVLELGARILGLQSGVFLLPSAENCLQRDPLLSLSFRPHCRGQLSETTFATNALGLRSPELRTDGARRILAIGDSTTWGWRVAQDESYPAVLQAALDARGGPGRFEVVNAGVPGYTSYQGLLYLRDRGLALAPHTVVATYGFNDVIEIGDIEVQLARERRLRALLRLDDFLLTSSTFYRWARWRENAVAPALPPRVPVDRYRANMLEIIRLARSRDARVILLDFWDPADPYGEALAGVVAETGVPVLPYRGPRLDVIHPTREGYRMIVDALLEKIATE